MKILENIAGVVLGLIAGFIVYVALGFIIELCISFPLLRLITALREDSWLRYLIPPAAFAFSAAWVGTKIANTSKLVSVCVIIFWVVNIISMFTGDMFTWKELIQSAIGIFVGAYCFVNSDVE